jgi:UDP-glucose 4-epimerase
MKFLIIGGAGFIGDSLARLLVKGKHEVAVLDNYSYALSSYVAETPYLSIAGDVTNIGTIDSILSATSPDVVVWFASYPNIDLGGEPLVGEANLVFSIPKIIPLLQTYRVKSFVLGSSHLVYQPGEELLNEGSPLNWGMLKVGPLNKIMAEWFTIFSCHKYEIPFQILRFSNIYGKRNFVNPLADPLLFMIDLLLFEENVIITASKQKLDYLHIDNAVKMIKKIILSKQTNQVFNVSSGIPIDNETLALAICEFAGRNELPKFVETTEASFVLDNSKALQLKKSKIHNALSYLPELIKWRREQRQL